MKALLMLHIFTVAVAASYVTLGVASAREARSLWWAYGIVTLILAVGNLLMERHHDG